MSGKPITDVMRNLGGGVFVEEATSTLAKAVKAVEDTGKAAKVVLTINLKKAPRGTNALYVSTSVASTIPKEDPAAELMYPTPEGTLLRDDPRQTKLDLKEAPGAKPNVPLKDATAA